ncbi:double-strand break repair helicase AddA [Radicibacter daui]|uniref:double-strand break repair helicase AddA n=1 Tax=Radicibacter daui TaxID=3064829 RepID=UPI004046C836
MSSDGEMIPVADAEAPGLQASTQQRRAADPVTSVWVGASAGTGKTKVLTDRVLRLLLAGTRPDRILCLTFTRAAAAEMANRLAQRLADWSTMAEAELELQLADLTGAGRPDAAERDRARRLFAEVLDTPGGLNIQTLHSFCQSLLRRFPVEAGIAPQFGLMETRSAEEAMAGAIAAVLHEARLEPDGEVGHALSRVTARLGEGEFAELLAELASERGRFNRMLEANGGLKGAIRAAEEALDVPPGTDIEALLLAACKDTAFDGPSLRQAMSALEAGAKTDKDRAASLANWLAADPARRAAGMAGYRDIFFTAAGERRARLATAGAVKAFPEIEEVLVREIERLERLAETVAAAECAADTAALFTLAARALDGYEQHKRRKALLDYDDLILGTIALLEQSRMAAWVLYKLDGGIDHILVDEAQDTNPDQWRVVRLIAEEFFTGESSGERPRTLFAVGDEKQSIYSFQRADPAEFRRMRDHFARRIDEAEQKWDRITLEVSFRSTSAVLAVVDALFNDVTARNGVLEDNETVRHRPFRSGHAGLVELWPPVEPQESDASDLWQPALSVEHRVQPAAQLAGAIAATAADWLARGEILPARGRPIAAGDIMVLVRRRNSFVEALVRAFKERGVPVAGADRLSLSASLAVQDLLALARFLLLPDDDLTLAALLKSPLVGLSEEALFDIAYDRLQRHGRTGLWAALQKRAAEEAALAPAADWLLDLIGRADFSTPFELFARILSAPCPGDSISGRRAMLGRLGAEAEEPLDEFLAQALAFERTHPPALQTFVHWMETGDTELKREQEGAGSGMVRIMTVHGSKGLQAPIVFMPDTLSTPLNGKQRLFWPHGEGDPRVPLWVARSSGHSKVTRRLRQDHDLRQQQEYRRLLYVAMTRAEDRLYVCGYATNRTAPADCWHTLVKDCLEKLVTGEAASRGELPPAALAAIPGWSGEILRVSHPQSRTASASQREEEAAAPVPPAPAWLTRPPLQELSPPKPLAPSKPDEEEPAARSPLEGSDGYRFQRGTLIHRLLQTLPDLPQARRGAAAAAYLARPVHRLSAAEQEQMVAETLAVLADPVFGPIFGPGSRAEVPLTGVVGHRVISGQIDRLLVSDDQVLIVDFKTNRPPPREVSGVAGEYLRQLGVYRTLVSRIYPGKPVRCALLWTDGPFLMEVPAGLMPEGL